MVPDAGQALRWTELRRANVMREEPEPGSTANALAVAFAKLRTAHGSLSSRRKRFQAIFVMSARQDRGGNDLVAIRDPEPVGLRSLSRGRSGMPPRLPCGRPWL